MKEANKKVTLESLIKNSQSRKANKLIEKEVFVRSLDGTVTLKEPTYDLCIDAITDSSGDDADVHLIFNSVISPNLKDKELQKAYDCSVPDDIVRKLFKPGEIATLSKVLISMAGYINSVKVVEDLKNA